MGNWNTLRAQPELTPFSPDTFAANLDQTPVDWRESMAAQAADSFVTSTTPGMALREAQTPDLPNKIIAGGRGGAKWRPETPLEVQARGDTLISTPEDMKASKYWRDTMDTTQPTTELRMKAISEQIDLSTARRAIASDHPVAAFLGGAGVTLLDPINYIPIFGEEAAAASVAKLGRFVGKTATGAADAMVNTAAMDLATLQDRKAHGDPMTVQQFGTDMAFGAIAGTIMAGTHAAVTGRAEARVAALEALHATHTAQAQVHERLVLNTAIDRMLASSDGSIEGLPRVAERAIQERVNAVNATRDRQTVRDVASVKSELGIDLSGSPLRSGFAAGPLPASASKVLDAPTLRSEIIRTLTVSDHKPDAGVAGIVSTMPEDVKTAIKAEAETQDRIAEAVKGKTEAEAAKIRDAAPATPGYYKAVQYVQQVADEHAKVLQAAAPAHDPKARASQIKDILGSGAVARGEIPDIVKTVTGRDAGLIHLSTDELSKVHDAVMKVSPSVASPTVSTRDRTRLEAQALLGHSTKDAEVRFDAYAKSKEEIATEMAVKQAMADVMSFTTGSHDPLDVQLAEAKAEGIDPETGANDLEPQVKSILETLSPVEVAAHMADMEAADAEFQRAQT
jgi:hypothetical protein